MNPRRDLEGVMGWLTPDLPPEQRILGLFWAKWAIGAIRAFSELGIADLLVAGPRTAAELSELTGTVTDGLYRMLRAVAAAGLLEERAGGTFALTAFAEGLVSDAPGGVRDMFLFASDPMLWRPYEDVAHSVRTGEPAFDHVFGASFYDYTKANPAAGAIFDRAMRQNHYPATDQIFESFDFARFRRIADIGGGNGQFLVEVLRRHPGCAGVLADQPHTVAEAKDVLEQGGVTDRVTIVPIDFFVEVPAGCDAYFIKHTLHNWDDEQAGLILRRVREAIGTDADARLLIVDMLLRGPGEWDVGKLIDIEAMAVLGGRERSRDEWDRLARSAGFAPANDPDPGNLVLLEYRPVPSGS